MSSSSSRPTYTSLDAFRGFAALWVVMDHGGLETIATRYPQLRHQPLFAFSTLGMLGVQIFFVISGFCIANAAASAAQRGKGTIAFAVARLRRIYPPYFFAALLTVSLSLLASFLVNHHYLRASRMAEANLLGHPPVWYLAQLTLTQVPLRQEPLMNVFWTLCYEVAFYAVVTAVLRGVRSAASPVHRLLQTLHAITVASAVLLAIAPRFCPFPFDLWPQFGLGALAYDFIAVVPGRRRPWIATFLTASALAVYVARYDLGGDAWHVGSRTTFTVAVAFAVILVCLHPIDARLARLPPVRLLGWIGAFSYSLYLTHMLPMGVTLQLGRPLLTTPARCTILFAAEVVASVAAAYPFFWLCERPFLSRRATVRAEAELSLVSPAIA